MPQDRQQLTFPHMHLGVRVSATTTAIRDAAASATSRWNRHEYPREAQVTMREPESSYVPINVKWRENKQKNLKNTKNRRSEIIIFFSIKIDSHVIRGSFNL